jgi:hypothetical protein
MLGTVHERKNIPISHSLLYEQEYKNIIASLLNNRRSSTQVSRSENNKVSQFPVFKCSIRKRPFNDKW